jgi:hypothetical protein
MSGYQKSEFWDGVLATSVMYLGLLFGLEARKPPWRKIALSRFGCVDADDLRVYLAGNGFSL